MKLLLCLLLALSFTTCRLYAQTVINGSRSITGSWDASGATATMPIKSGLSSATPSTCVASKELYLKTDATPGQQVFICNAAGNGFVLSGGGGSTTIASTTSALKGDGAGNGVAVTGTATDCVKVNGTSGACGAGGSKYYTLPLRLHSPTLATSTTAHSYQGILPAANTAAGTSNNSFRVKIPVTGTIIAARAQMYNGATSTAPGTDTEIKLCIDGSASGGAACNGTSVTIGTGLSMPAQFASIFAEQFSLSQAVTAGQFITVDLLPGTFTTSAIVTLNVEVVIQW